MMFTPMASSSSSFILYTGVKFNPKPEAGDEADFRMFDTIIIHAQGMPMASMLNLNRRHSASNLASMHHISIGITFFHSLSDPFHLTPARGVLQ